MTRAKFGALLGVLTVGVAATTTPLVASDIIQALGYTPMSAAVLGQPLGAAQLDSLGGLQNISLNGNARGGQRVSLPISGGCGTGATAIGSAQDFTVTPGSSATTYCGYVMLPGSWPNAPLCVATSIGTGQPIGMLPTTAGSGSVGFQSPTVFYNSFVVHCWG